MSALVLRWSVGNEKLKRTRTVSFNLPAFQSADGFRVCPGARMCAAVCYARQGRYMMPDPSAARETNLAIVRASLELFERLAVADLNRIKQRSIRVHDSGDFFSQAYLDTWFRIARQFDGKRFYCYSKSLHLDWSDRPENWQLVQSAGGKFDARIDYALSHTRIFTTDAERHAAGYSDGNTTDRPAQRGDTRIGLTYHGTTKLTPRTIWLIQRG